MRYKISQLRSQRREIVEKGAKLTSLGAACGAYICNSYSCGAYLKEFRTTACEHSVRQMWRQAWTTVSTAEKTFVQHWTTNALLTIANRSRGGNKRMQCVFLCHRSPHLTRPVSTKSSFQKATVRTKSVKMVQTAGNTLRCAQILPYRPCRCCDSTRYSAVCVPVMHFVRLKAGASQASLRSPEVVT